MSRSDEMPENDFFMTDPMALKQLETYWRSLMSGGRVPRRSDIDPAALGAVIENAMILERVGPGVARVRVAGQNVSAFTGAEARGLPLSVFFDHASRAELTNLTEKVFKKPAIVEMSVLSTGGFRQPALHGRLLMLPLLDEHARVSRCLAALVASGRRGGGMRRFSINQDEMVRCEPIQTLSVIETGGSHRRGAKKAGPLMGPRLIVNNV